MKAVILAGGRGTRLHPFTVSFPKPLMPLGDVPVLEVLMQRLIHYGITDMTLCLGHLAGLVQAYLDQRKSLTSQVRLNYVLEDQPTGTAGSLSLVPNLDETFLVLNGDLLTNIDMGALVEYHRRQDAVLTIATHARRVKIDLGVLEFDDNHVINNYLEKPETTYHVSMGIYVYEPRVLSYIPRGAYLDFPDLVMKLIAAKEKVVSYVTDCVWLDIGRPDDYARAQELFSDRKEDFERV
jgi:NDP-sugar pyrophosphorylase family protein